MSRVCVCVCVCMCVCVCVCACVYRGSGLVFLPQPDSQRHAEGDDKVGRDAVDGRLERGRRPRQLNLPAHVQRLRRKKCREGVCVCVCVCEPVARVLQ